MINKVINFSIYLLRYLTIINSKYNVSNKINFGSKSANNFFKKNLKKCNFYLEYGSGNSTILANKFNKKFNGMDAETLAGLFINKLGFLPKVGDKIELDDMILAVTAADKRKIKKIGITIKTNL